jgi:hypothetical protein
MAVFMGLKDSVTVVELWAEGVRSSHKATCHNHGWKLLEEAADLARESDKRPAIARQYSGESCTAN